MGYRDALSHQHCPEIVALDRLSAVQLFQRRAFVHRDVVGLVALEFVRRIILARMVRVPLVLNILCVHPDDGSADVPGLRVPGHVIADFACARHDGFASGGGFFYMARRISPPPHMIDEG
jgi:hypothetical protein